MQKLGRIAFITTPEYRDKHPEEIEDFVYRHLYFLCNWFEVLCTGRTYSFVLGIANRSLDQVDPIRISEAT
ncbi:MAG TPA: hypothetical protein VFQ23_09215, partial [Anaerolineales bacterium]|nr:hypothetical protein [Anaerolineales bacterium]